MLGPDSFIQTSKIHLTSLQKATGIGNKDIKELISKSFEFIRSKKSNIQEISAPFLYCSRKKLQKYFRSQNDSEIKRHLPNGFGHESSWPHLAE